MRQYYYIAIGGMMGAVLRVVFKNIQLWNKVGTLPYDTFLVNVIGSLFLALFLSLTVELFNFKVELRLGLTTGFLGAFTTFSTLCKEIANLLFQGQYTIAFLYMIITVVFGLFATWVGIFIAKAIKRRVIRNRFKTGSLMTTDYSEGE